MAAEIVNLRLARKRKARAEKADKAAENRVRHGLTKEKRNRSRAESELERRRFEAGRREISGGEEPGEPQ